MEIISLVLNFLLGGSLLVTLVTLRSQGKRAKAQAEEDILSNWQKFIGEPLRKEIKELRSEVSKFRKAVDKISVCSYASDCPVRNELKIESEKVKVES